MHLFLDVPQESKKIEVVVLEANEVVLLMLKY